MNPRQRLNSIPAITVYAGFAVAMAYLFFFQFAPGAPQYSGGISPNSVLNQTRIFDQIDSVVATAAEGHSVVYHVRASPEEWAQKQSGNYLTAFFSLVYNQYPRQVCVGDGSAVINFPADFRQADVVPSDIWLHDHGIPVVVTLIPDVQNGPQLLLHRVR